MKKLLIWVSAIVFSASAFAQTSNNWKQDAMNKAGDHLMIQLTSDHWAGAPDSITNHMGGISRGLNISFMMSKPFKTNPKWSVAFGLGISNSNIFFKKMGVQLDATSTKLPFVSQDSSNSFKKYKLATTFLEIPVELRFALHPEKEKSSWKFAIGAKLGTLLDAHTKGKTLQNKSGTTIGSYKEKLSRKSYFNSSRIAFTARAGIGNFSLFGSYTITKLLKDGAGADIRPYQIGVCISGL
jgi:Outer membrane protein beta-barrel domain